MLLFIRYFLGIIALFHIFSVALIYGMDIGLSSTSIALIREIIRSIFFLVILVFYSPKNHYKNFIQKFYNILGITTFLFLYSIIFSIFMGKSGFDIVIGIKYTLRYIIIFLIAIYIGTVVQTQKESEKKVKKFINWLIKFVIIIIAGGIIRQLLKHLIPSFFYNIGYGPIGDFVFGSAPPLYYRTGPGGIPRLSGIFSGPNNYGYFLILYTSLILYVIQTKLKEKKSIQGGIYGILYSISSLLTLSRGVLVGIFSQIIISLYTIKKTCNQKKIITTIILTTFVTSILILISIYKGGSSMEHIYKTLEGLEFIANNPMGFGLGTAGPAIHHQGTLLPENYYLQLISDIGYIGTLVRCLLRFVIIGTIKKTIIINNELNRQIIYLMLLGLGGLAIEGLFLHVFEDSMVNYLFFIPFGIILGYQIQQDNKSVN